MSESEKKVIEMLIPKVDEAVKSLVDGTFAAKLPELKNAMENELWDKAVAKIGEVAKLPKNVIEGLQKIDDIVKEKSATLEQLIKKVEEFKDHLKGVEVHKSIVLTYAEIQRIRVKAACSWAITGFLSGIFVGIVVILNVLHLI